MTVLNFEIHKTSDSLKVSNGKRGQGGDLMGGFINKYHHEVLYDTYQKIGLNSVVAPSMYSI